MMPLVLSGLRLRTLWVATALALLLAGMGSWTRLPDPDLVRADGTEGVEIWVLDNGFHTDLAVPRAALEARAGPLGDAVRPAFFGLGARRLGRRALLCRYATDRLKAAGRRARLFPPW